MEIILKKDYKGLGYKNEVVEVAPGYARNFLIPKGFALYATESNKKVAAENIRQAQHRFQILVVRKFRVRSFRLPKPCLYHFQDI